MPGSWYPFFYPEITKQCSTECVYYFIVYHYRTHVYDLDVVAVCEGMTEPIGASVILYRIRSPHFFSKACFGVCARATCEKLHERWKLVELISPTNSMLFFFNADWCGAQSCRIYTCEIRRSSVFFFFINFTFQWKYCYHFCNYLRSLMNNL